MQLSKEERRELMLKEVEIIQAIIRRMAFHSFFIKGWTVTLVAVVLLLRGTPYQALIAYVPLLVFWFLDAYFLWQERLYRRLYNWVIRHRWETDEHLLDMNAYRFKGEEQPLWRVMFSLTLGGFYGSLLVLTLVYSMVLFVQGSGS